MIISAKTDVGAFRENNQDAFLTGTFVNGDAWAIVCDGMGGVSGGQIASTLCVEKAASVIKKGYRNRMSVKSVKNLLESAISAANAVVYPLSLLIYHRAVENLGNGEGSARNFAGVVCGRGERDSGGKHQRQQNNKRLFSRRHILHLLPQDRK